MKEYKVMVKGIKTGEWIRAHNGMHRSGTFKSKDAAILYADAFMVAEQKKRYPAYSEYKIMTREVTPWEDI